MMVVPMRCPICGSMELSAVPSRVAPFISHYVLASDDVIACRLMTCEACRFSFFDRRFGEEETARLYSGYRGAEYVRAREKHEPAYASVNALLSDGSAELVSRKANLDALLRANFGSRSFHKVLDYGGDRGQFIPGFFRESEKYVYDLSDSGVVPGIRRLADPGEAAPFDFIMCCHVLEHVAHPAALLRGILPLLSDGGGLYLEVPWESIPMDMLVQRRMPVLKRFVTTPAMHEHVSFFTATAVVRLARLLGMNPLCAQVVQLPLWCGRGRVVSVLATNAEGEFAVNPLRVDIVNWLMRSGRISRKALAMLRGRAGG